MGECNGLTEFSSCTVAVRPKVDAVGPSKGPVGHVMTVHIFGEGFGSNPTVSAGSGIAVSVDSATNTEIEATFNIAAAAPGGNHQVIVTVSGKPSIEPVNFFVQIPTSISLVTTGTKVTYNGNDLIECDGDNLGPDGDTRAASLTGLWTKKSIDNLSVLRIRSFSLKDADLDEASAALSELPEFKEWISERNLRRREFWIGSLKTKEKVSLTLTNVTFQTVLNELTKKYGRSDWSVFRYSTTVDESKMDFIAIYFGKV